jgi:hypothetical protein
MRILEVVRRKLSYIVAICSARRSTRRAQSAQNASYDAFPQCSDTDELRHRVNSRLSAKENSINVCHIAACSVPKEFHGHIWSGRSLFTILTRSPRVDCGSC